MFVLLFNAFCAVYGVFFSFFGVWVETAFFIAVACVGVSVGVWVGFAV